MRIINTIQGYKKVNAILGKITYCAIKYVSMNDNIINRNDLKAELKM